MNRWDEIQATARDVAEQIQPDHERRDTIADNLIKLVGLMIEATGKGVACEGEGSMNDSSRYGEETPGEAAAAHNRYLIGEQMQSAAREAARESSNPECDLDRYERSGLKPVWVSKIDRTEIRPGIHTWGQPHAPGRLTEAANAVADDMRDRKTRPVPDEKPLFAPGAEAYYRSVLGLDYAPQVPHAPGKAILCPDCRTKGLAVCMDHPHPSIADETDKFRDERAEVDRMNKVVRTARWANAGLPPVGTPWDAQDEVQRSAMGLSVKHPAELCDDQDCPTHGDAGRVGPCVRDVSQPLQHTWVTAVDDHGFSMGWQHCGICGIRHCAGGCGDASVGASPDVDCPVHVDEIARRCRCV